MEGTARREAPLALLWGALVILGWALLSILFAPGDAHAAEGDDRPGLLSAVTDTVRAGTDVIGDTVEAVTAPVSQVTDAVLTKTTAAVEPVATPVVQAASKPVEKTVRETPIADVVEPLTELVTSTPVVGDALTELGVDRLLDRTAGAVDDVVGTVVTGTESVIDVVAPVAPAPVIDPDTAAPSAPDAAPSRLRRRSAIPHR